MIKNIILDVGDVLLEYCWKQMLMDHGLSEEEALELGRIMFDDPLWEEFDVAVRPREEIIADYVKKYPKDAQTITWFMAHGELMHVPRPEVWEQVHQLKEKGYRIYILSNYSEELFQKHTADAPFIRDADGIVVSYQVHEMKPNPPIYRHLLEKYGLKPEECLFFDDREKNTEGARHEGIHAVTVRSREHLTEELGRLLVHR